MAASENRAVAKGPALKSVYTGAPCDHDKYLCQYELGKAIKLCGGVAVPPRAEGR